MLETSQAGIAADTPCPLSDTAQWTNADAAKAASLIGSLGQARFPCLFWGIVTHPGNASLRSLVDAVMAPLHAYVGTAVESLA